MENTLNKLKDTIAQLTENGELYTTDINGLSLFRRSSPTEAFKVMYEPSLCVIVQGKKQVSLGTETFAYDKSEYLFTSIHVPTIAQVIKASDAEPYLGLRLKLDYHEVAQMIIEHNLNIPSKKKLSDTMATGKMSEPIANSLLRMVSLLNHKEDIPILAPLIQKELIYYLLISEQGWSLREIVTMGSQSQQITKTIDWLRDNYAKNIHIQELASMTGMSISTFHEHFRNLTKLSPLQFQKQLRLQEARQLMFHNHHNAADAAFRVGYESPSQFSREYRRFFGDTPLKDISKLREIFIT